MALTGVVLAFNLRSTCQLSPRERSDRFLEPSLPPGYKEWSGLCAKEKLATNRSLNWHIPITVLSAGLTFLDGGLQSRSAPAPSWLRWVSAPLCRKGQHPLFSSRSPLPCRTLSGGLSEWTPSRIAICDFHTSTRHLCFQSRITMRVFATCLELIPGLYHSTVSQRHL